MSGMKAGLLVSSIAIAAVSCGGKEYTVGDTDIGDSTDTAWDDDGDTAPGDTLPGDTAADDPTPDATDDDAAADCPAWRLVDVQATGVTLVDPTIINTERTFRVSVSADMGGCEKRAMPLVEIDATALTVTVTLRAWEEVGVECPADLWHDTRLIALKLPAAGTWTVLAPPASAGATVVVGAPPPRPCNPGMGTCEMDCDCPDGSVCLGGFGLGGPMNACDVPCEEDVDCVNGQPCMLVVDDYLDHVCSWFGPGFQCDGSDPCPDGWSCTDGTCLPSFTLGGSVRVECSCDADCAAPLECARPASPSSPSRCELLCGTAGALNCPGAHACGPASADLSGLAFTDSVCGWLGE